MTNYEEKIIAPHSHEAPETMRDIEKMMSAVEASLDGFASDGKTWMHARQRFAWACDGGYPEGEALALTFEELKSVDTNLECSPNEAEARYWAVRGEEVHNSEKDKAITLLTEEAERLLRTGHGNVGKIISSFPHREYIGEPLTDREVPPRQRMEQRLIADQVEGRMKYTFIEGYAVGVWTGVHWESAQNSSIQQERTTEDGDDWRQTSNASVLDLYGVREKLMWSHPREYNGGLKAPRARLGKWLGDRLIPKK